MPLFTRILESRDAGREDSLLALDPLRECLEAGISSSSESSEDRVEGVAPRPFERRELVLESCGGCRPNFLFFG